MSEAEKNALRKEFHDSQGKLNYLLEVFGDELAKRRKYKTRNGMDAIWFYLVEKYQWTPATVRAMHPDDLHFLLHEEMSGWSAPKSAR